MRAGWATTKSKSDFFFFRVEKRLGNKSKSQKQEQDRGIQIISTAFSTYKTEITNNINTFPKHLSISILLFFDDWTTTITKTPAENK